MDSLAPFLILIALAASVATFLGGFFALRFKDKLHLILGFSAGAVVAVAFFDLLPEAFIMGEKYFDVSFIASAIAGGFLFYLLLDRLLSLHLCREGECENPVHMSRGRLAAGALSLHSFLDGVAVGFAFQVSWAVGAVVATAVLVHDFSDGINTVSMILKNNGSKLQALKWLILDATAPVAGITTTIFLPMPESFLGIILAIFCGFFLYIGASDLLPESHHSHPTHWTLFMTLLGVLVLWVAIRLAGL